MSIMSNNINSVEFNRSVKNRIGPEIFTIDTNEAPAKPVRALDANVYATKKTIAQGMLDVALLTANASQLKYLLQIGKKHEFYILMVTLISTSIVLQIAVGIAILLKSRCNINNCDHHKKAELYNNAIVWLVFFITGINLFISAFGIDPNLNNRISDGKGHLYKDDSVNVTIIP